MRSTRLERSGSFVDAKHNSAETMLAGVSGDRIDQIVARYL